MRQTTSWVLCCALFAASGLGHALELGPINVDPVPQIGWQAQVSVVDARGLTRDDIELRLGSAEQYAQASINPEMAAQVRVDWDDETDATVITIAPASSALASKSIAFLLSLRWSEGQLTRPYQVTVGESFSAEALADSRFGPTRSTDTLFGIANALRPNAVATNQMMLALLANNPKAFNQPNVNALQRNVVLNVPARAALEFPQADVATAEVLKQTRIWRQADPDPLIDEAPVAEADEQPLQVLTPIINVVAEPEPESEPESEPISITALYERPEWQGLLNQLSRVESSSESLRADNAQLRSTLSALREDVARLEARFNEPAADNADASASNNATVDVEGVKVWVLGQTTQALAAPAQAFHLPLVRWLAAAMAAVVTLLLLTAWLSARRRRNRSLNSATLPSEWRPGSARPHQRGDDSAVVTAPANAPADPVEQASALIGYGQLAQAQSILDEALGGEPERIDLRVKLLDVLAMRDDRAGFEAEAHVLHAQLGDEQDPRWQRAARQGRRLVGENHPLFAERPAPNDAG